MAAFLAGAQESRRLVSCGASSAHHNHHTQLGTRTSSTCSQVSELDEDELEEEEGKFVFRAAGEASEAYLASMDPVLQKTDSKVAASTGAAASRQQHQPAGKRCFRQLLQSIPVSLAATSIITVIILCLLLRECKSLQLSSTGSSKLQSQAAALEMPPSRPPQVISHGPVHSGDSGESNKLLEREREVLRREIIGELVGLQQQQQREEIVKRQHSAQNSMHKRQHSASLDGAQQQVAPPVDTLAALLMSAGVGATPDSQMIPEDQELFFDDADQLLGESAEADRYLDGEAEASLDSRPDRLHSSSQQQQQQQQPQLGSNNKNHQRQFQSHQQRVKQLNFRGLNAGERPYDVVQIYCNNSDEGFERFACARPDSSGRHKCIEDRMFCDGNFDCPAGEDESPISCMYYRLVVSHIDILTNTFLSWMKKQNRLSAHRLDIGVA